jgi:hypothetical protein
LLGRVPGRRVCRREDSSHVVGSLASYTVTMPPSPSHGLHCFKLVTVR